LSFVQYTMGYWHQRADERLSILSQGNQQPLMVTDEVGIPQVS